MTYKLFIDDERYPPLDKYRWFIARSSDEAIKTIYKYGMPYFISFDHDLGGDDTSIVFINWLIDSVIENELEIPDNFSYNVHSQNPVGAMNIYGKMENLIKHFKGIKST